MHILELRLDKQLAFSVQEAPAVRSVDALFETQGYRRHILGE